MNMTQNYSLLPHKGNSPRKAKHSKITQICSKNTISTSLLSTMMTYLNTYEIGLIQERNNAYDPKLFTFTA